MSATQSYTLTNSGIEIPTINVGQKMTPDLKISILKPTERLTATVFWIFCIVFCTSFFSVVFYQLYRIFAEKGSIPTPLIIFGIIALTILGAFFVAGIIGLKYSFFDWKLAFSKDQNAIWLERKNSRKNTLKFSSTDSLATRVKVSGCNSFSWELLLQQPKDEQLIMNYQLSSYNFDKIDKSRREYCRPIEDYFESPVIHLDYEN